MVLLSQACLVKVSRSLAGGGAKSPDSFGADRNRTAMFLDTSGGTGKAEDVKPKDAGIGQKQKMRGTKREQTIRPRNSLARGYTGDAR